MTGADAVRGAGEPEERPAGQDQPDPGAAGRYCPACSAHVLGDWTRCPLCTTALTGDPLPGPFPEVPLTFSRRRLFRALAASSLAVVLGSLAVQLLFERSFSGVGVFRSLWLGVSAMWLVVLTAASQRRNVARTALALVVVLSLVAVYWDYLTGWHDWGLTYAVPIVCAAMIVAVLITVFSLRIEVGEHIVYSGLTVLLGLVPLVFLALGWVSNPWPSVLSACLSLFTLLTIPLARGAELRHELAKFLHL